MRRRSVIVLSIIMCVVILFWVQTTIRRPFDPGDRYPSTRLDYMGVVYANRSDIHDFREGYSETEDCPWGFIHSGIDYFFYNNSRVIAAAPGYVERIWWQENENSSLNLYNIFVNIRFNASVVLHYLFEPSTHTVGDQYRQISMLTVKVGDWVMKGDTIGRLLNVDGGGLLHFSVMVNDKMVDPVPFFGESDLQELLELVHTYHPDWNVSYPAP